MPISIQVITVISGVYLAILSFVPIVIFIGGEEGKDYEELFKGLIILLISAWVVFVVVKNNTESWEAFIFIMLAMWAMPSSTSVQTVVEKLTNYSLRFMFISFLVYGVLALAINI